MVSRQFFVFKDLILKGHNCNTFQYLVTMSPALQRVLVTLRRHTRAFSGGVAGKRLLFSDTREIYRSDVGGLKPLRFSEGIQPTQGALALSMC
jgi:hypothetical protein